MPTLMSGISNVGSKEGRVNVEDAGHSGSQQTLTNLNGGHWRGGEKNRPEDRWSIMLMACDYYCTHGASKGKRVSVSQY